MQSSEDIQLLYQIISKDNSSFEDLSLDFNSKFSKNKQFDMGMLLTMLINNNLITLSQKISSLYLLNEIQINENNSFFTPFLLRYLRRIQNKAEKKLICDILENKIDYKTSKIKSFIEDSLLNFNNNRLQIINSLYQNFAEENQECLGRFDSDKIRPVLYEKKVKPNDFENKANIDFSKMNGNENINDDNNLDNKLNNEKNNNKNIQKNEEFSFNFFEPNFLTLFPETDMNLYENEPYFMIPGLDHNFSWNTKTKK